MATTTTTTAVPGKYLNLDETPVQGQTGWALLDLNGNILVKSGGISEANVDILYQMLLETTGLVQDFRKLTVAFTSSQYLVSRDEDYVYVVETTVTK